MSNGLRIHRFGRGQRGMVGVRQCSSSGSRAAYLLCRPMGQEAVRTAAVFRVLAERLAREGCDSLRFDYHGTGDSAGEESEQDLAGWIDDILDADTELRAASSAPVSWFGMGLGAVLALRAAARTPHPPRHLVLWEPVLDGPGYVRALLDGHRAELTRELGEPWPRLLRSGKVVEPTLPGDILGFDVGPALAADLDRLPPLSLAPALRRGIRVTCAIHAGQRAILEPLEGSTHLRVHEVESKTDWMSSQAMGTAVVPPDLPRVLLSTLE